jgi:hypothetical protein
VRAPVSTLLLYSRGESSNRRTVTLEKVDPWQFDWSSTHDPCVSEILAWLAASRGNKFTLRESYRNASADK